LDFRDEYAKLVPGKYLNKQQGTSAGRLPNKYAIGCAILWMPFFLMGHLLAIGLKAAGYAITLDGTGYIYQASALVGSITYGFAGILIFYRSCCRFFSKSNSAAAVILIWLGTYLIYYMTAEPSMSHACSFFAVALFLNLWLAFRPSPTPRQWIFLGLAGGLVALVRLADSTWLVVPVLDSLWALRTNPGTNLFRCVKGLSAFGLASTLVFVPQMAVWRALNGALTSVGYLHHAERSFFWFSPQILGVLFARRHGLFLWHPVLLFAACGLVLLYRRNRAIACLLSLGFAMQVYLISAWYGWFGGAAFGARMLASSLPALGLGLAALIEWAVNRGALRIVCILAGCILVWNAAFFAQYRFGYISMTEPVTLSQMTLGKIYMLKDFWQHLKALI
jgi:hypothetical protein